MSAHAVQGKALSLPALLAKLGALAIILGVAMYVHRLAPAKVGDVAAPVAALGLLLLAGDLLAEILERFKLPHLTGFLLAGVMVGPHGLGVVSSTTVHHLSLVNALALALIALSAGAELTLGLLKEGARSLLWAILGQVCIALPLLVGAFWLMAPHLSFLGGMSPLALLGVALIWGIVAVSRSPSATLGVLAQVRPDGPLTRYTLALVMAFDIVVLLIFSFGIQLARTLIEPGAEFDLKALQHLGTELMGSVSGGLTLGLLVAAYLRWVKRQRILFLVLISYGIAEFCTYFGFDALLLFVVAGFVVANVSRQGGVLLESVSQGGRVVYVLFFATAGAHLDLPLLVRLWPIALGLATVRIVATILSARAASRLAGDPPVIRKYGWMPLVSQAGVTLGMALVVSQAFAHSFGPGFQALALAVVGINEVVGPILFKWALDRSGESGRGRAPEPSAH